MGSSITMSCDFIESARAISTICCSATERSRTRRAGCGKADAFCQNQGLLFKLLAADEKLGAWFTADEHVFGDGHVGSQGELLIDGDNALGLGRLGAIQNDGFAVQFNAAGIGSLGPGKNFQEGRFARAIFTKEGVISALPTSKSTDQGPSRRKGLGNPGHAEQGWAAGGVAMG